MVIPETMGGKLMNNPHLSKKEQQQIEKTIKAGRDARRKLKNYCGGLKWLKR